MKLSSIIQTTIALVIVFGLSTPVAAKTLISEGMRQGVTWRTYLLKKKYVKQISLGGETRKIYLANTETHNSYSGVSQSTDLVQCSTSEPFVAFKDAEFDPGLAILHYINPGGDTSSAMQDSHWLYWAVCHSVYEPWQYDLANKAKQLGYSLAITERQIEIPDLLREIR